MGIDLTQIILALITVLGGIITAVIVPWLRGKLDTQKMETLKALIKTGVFAAEQLYNTDQGQQKKEYVLNLLKEKGYIVDIETVETSILAALEAAVKELKIEMK